MATGVLRAQPSGMGLEYAVARVSTEHMTVRLTWADRSVAWQSRGTFRVRDLLAAGTVVGTSGNDVVFLQLHHGTYHRTGACVYRL